MGGRNLFQCFLNRTSFYFWSGVADAPEKLIFPQLEESGTQEIALVITSQPDFDHQGGTLG